MPISNASVTAIFVTLAAAAWLAACATLPADPALLAAARTTIAEAETAGAEDHAAGPLNAARQRIALAETELERRRGMEAKRLADQAELDARVALAQTRVQQIEAELVRRREALEHLESTLRAEFGDALEEGL